MQNRYKNKLKNENSVKEATLSITKE